MKKNTCFEGVCIAFGSNGEGIVKDGLTTVFVPQLLPGEKARIKLLKTKGNIAYGKAEEIYTPAEDRVRPKCAVFSRCGGCQLQHLRYRAQLKYKSDLVREALRKIGGISCEVPLCERSEKEYAYRNKLQLPVGRNAEGNAVGFYAERSHRIVKTDACPIHPEWAEKVISALYRFMETCGLDGYDEVSREGQLRHIIVRELKGKFIVTLVVTVREIKGIDFFTHLLDGIFPEYTLYLNVNAGQTNAVLGEEFILIKGPGAYSCTENGITFEAGASTFVQVNEDIRGKLYEKAVSFAEEGDTVVDCYAGGGLMTAMFARKCGRAYGIEIVPEASACADVLKEENGLSDKMTNICGKVEDNLASLLAREKNAVVVLDPPRAGAERSVLKEIAAHKVKKIIMISCNPATLARDLGILTGSLTETLAGELVKSAEPSGGYKIDFIQPYDMFPQTKWVETLAVLTRK